MDFDFPLDIKLEIENPQLISKIGIFITDKDLNKTIVSNIQPIEDDLINYNWKNAPPSGTYNISTEITTWSQEKINSSEILITVNNTTDKNDDIK